LGTSDPLKQRLTGRPNLWTEAPGLHFEFSDDSVEAVFDGRKVSMTAAEVVKEVGRNAILHNAPYSDRTLAASEAVAMILFRKLTAEFDASGRGSWADAKMMAEKARRKADRVPAFKAWLVHML